MKTQYFKKYIIILGLILFLGGLRGGEYAFDYLFGNGDGRMTTPPFAFILSTIYYSSILGIIAVLLSWRKIKRKEYLFRVCAVLLTISIAYIVLFFANFFLYKYGYHLLSSETRELCYSLGIFEITSHPQYRTWLKSFVLPANGPERIGFPGDAFRALGLPSHTQKTSWSSGDQSGWVNNKPVEQAEVLFIGDSFCFGSGAGYEHSIPVLYEKYTGIKTYNASNGGYGLPHYLEILRKLLQPDSVNNSRFNGRIVYILLYIGNDLSIDMNTFQQRVEEEQTSRIWHYLKLNTIRRIMRYRSVLIIDKQETASKTGEIKKLSAIDRKKTNGWYPNFTRLPAYEGVPFAFYTGHKRDYGEIDWFDDKRKRYIKEILASLKALSEQHHLKLRFVVLPTKLQVLFPHLELHPSEEKLEFDKFVPIISRNQNYASAYIIKEIQKTGLEVLDMKPIFDKEILTRPLFWPGDTHYAPEGHLLVTKSIISAFSDNLDQHSSILELHGSKQ